MLAAGGSHRMGQPKQLLRWSGRSLVAHAVATAEASACRRTFVVLGSAAPVVEAELATYPVDCVVNPEWRSGLASSIRVGVRAVLSAEQQAERETGLCWDGLLLALADQPAVSPQILDALVSRFQGADERAIVACTYAGIHGVPALFGRSHFEALCALEGDRGARQLIETGGHSVLGVPFEGASIDVDTPEDYRALLAQQPSPADADSNADPQED